MLKVKFFNVLWYQFYKIGIYLILLIIFSYLFFQKFILCLPQITHPLLGLGFLHFRNLLRNIGWNILVKRLSFWALWTFQEGCLFFRWVIFGRLNLINSHKWLSRAWVCIARCENITITQLLRLGDSSTSLKDTQRAGLIS